jgi:hypothetical protein
VKSLAAFLIFVSTIVPFAAQQSTPRHLVLEVVETDGLIDRSTTYVYLRVFSDGTTEAHDLQRLDLRAVQLRSGTLASSTYRELEDALRSQWFENLPEKTGPFYHETDTLWAWDLTAPSVGSARHLQFVNFNPYVTTYLAKKTYPRELERFVCLVWKAREEAIQESEKGLAAGCLKFHSPH